jgi:hypothetical protein
MRSVSSFASCLLVLALAACGRARETSSSGSATCFGCHSETTQLGIKIKWAEAGYDNSVHAHGQVERIYTQSLNGGCPPFVQATAATCTGQGGTHGGAAGGNVCTMPPTTSPTVCNLAGGTWSAPELDARVPNGPGAGQCPQFAQATATAGTAQACTVGGGTFAAPTCTTTNIRTQNGCETAGGVWVGPRFVWVGIEHAGSNAFYANSGGCQMCHTQEGFRKRVAKAYDPEDGSYSLQFGWNTAAQVGSPTTTPNTPLTRDVITNPSPLACFGCHTPHAIGSQDGRTLDQTVPVRTAVTTQTGAVWGNATTGTNKAKGHLCAECHQIRLNNQPTTSASILANVTGTGKFSVSASYGPHHGPQADMILGKGGAQYAGAAACGASCTGTFAFNGVYGNSSHTANVNADCVSCHMQSDYSDINVTGSFAVDAAVGGHSFTNKGFVHGAEKGLAIGCGSVTDGVGCHTVAGVTGSTGNQVRASTFTQTTGFLQAGEAFFQKSTSPTAMVDSKYQLKVNELLSRLANPSANCAGLLQDAVVAAGGALSWATLFDGATTDPRCIFNGTTTGINKAAAPADDNTNLSTRFLKGLWNFKFVFVEDKSFGVHNTTYALELLYDSCTDLALATGKPCGDVAGRCSFCEGTYVTARP